MLNCPACDTPLEQDFGMITCPGCKAMLMIDISGKVQMMGDESHADESWDNTSEISEQQESTSTFNQAEWEGSEASDFAESTAVEQEATAFAGDESTETLPDQETPETENDDFQNDFFTADAADNENDFTDDEESEAVDSFAEPEVESDAESWDTPEDSANEALFEDTEDHEASNEDVVDSGDDFSEEPQETFPMAATPDSAPVDVTEFANSEESNLEGGEILYDLTIERIDGKDQREVLKYTLFDEKLKINGPEYMGQIKDGRLVIPDLNPIKAKRIVEQLQYSDLDIRWRQKRVIMEVVDPDESGDDNEANPHEEAEL